MLTRNLIHKHTNLNYKSKLQIQTLKCYSLASIERLFVKAPFQTGNDFDILNSFSPFPLCFLFVFFVKNRNELSERMIFILKLPAVHCNRAYCFGNNMLSSYNPLKHIKQNTTNIKYSNRSPDKCRWEEESDQLAICFFCTIRSIDSRDKNFHSLQGPLE